MREISDCGALKAHCAGDTLCMWAAQGLDGRSRAWVSEDRRAVAIAGPVLSARDRLAVWGAPDAAVQLVSQVLAQVGPTYRPLGRSALIDMLVHEVPGLTPVGTFGWMDRQGLTGDGSLTDGAAEWLPASALAEIEALVEISFPNSYAKPGVPGVERWAGVRDHAGRLAAVGAFAWCAPTVGFLSGVAVHPRARKRGFGRQVCDLLVTEALMVHGTVALMVNDWNRAAIRLYEGMGLQYSPLSAAAVRTR
ncbi:GNAT family N-acetyltransferase [Streptomyces sp. QTS52]